jgi:LuxR family transcriptional regulator, maltose regulon positive regulatory protein
MSGNETRDIIPLTQFARLSEVGVQTILLSTKLFVPSLRPRLVSRSRVVEMLDSGVSGGLTLVSAPAGFGKTTILAQWTALRRDTKSIGWVQLDAGDNDPVRFWQYFTAALTRLRQSIGVGASAMLRSPQTPPIERVLTSLLNDLADLQEDFVVILDDYHLIKTRAIHDAVAYLVEHRPPTLHLVMATRADPSLPLARWQGRGDLVEIKADVLRFTSDEAAELLRKQGLDLGERDSSAVNAKAEGWAVGLTMVATALRGRPNVSQFLASFGGSQRYITDYLIEEALSLQPAEVRAFLLDTSILEKLTAPLCEAVTGTRDARAMLAGLEQANLFLFPVDDARQWYRYHHLFADLLRAELLKLEGEARVLRLNQVASRWYEENGFLDDAVHHALAARDWDTVARIANSVAEERFNRGEIVTVFDWLKGVPESFLSKDLGLYRHYCRTLTETGRVNAAEVALDRLQRAARGDPNFEGEVAYLRSDAAIRSGKVNLSIKMAEDSLSLLSPTNAVYRRLATFRIGFNEHHRGSLDRAWDRLSESYRIAMEVGDRNVAAWSANFMASVLHQRGDLKKALEMATRGLEIAGQSPAAAGPSCRLSIIPYEMNDLETSLRNAGLAVEWSRLTGDSASVVGYIYMALAKLAHGDTPGAVEAMSRCDAAVREPKILPYSHARHVVARVLFAIRQNDPDTASEWGKRLSEFPDCFPFEFAHVPARLLILQGRKAEAFELLRVCYDNAVCAGAKGLAIGIRICQALASTTEAKGSAFLAEALVTGQASGYYRTFVDEGRMLTPLLRRALSDGITPDFTASLLSVIETEQLRSSRQGGESRLVAPGLLTEREVQVLRLVAEGLSNQEIAASMIVSLSTVKTHVYHVFEKLNARDRVQAIARGRQLNLL